MSVATQVTFSGASAPAQLLIGSEDYDQDVQVHGVGSGLAMAIGFGSGVTTTTGFGLIPGAVPVGFKLSAGDEVWAVGDNNVVISGLATESC